MSDGLITIDITYSIGSANFTDTMDLEEDTWDELDHDGKYDLVMKYVKEQLDSDLEIEWSVQEG